MKKCIFCYQPSHDSKSIEHIIPQSLGGLSRTLPKGIVCDKCNNYFASKVEAPIINHISFQNLRANYQIPNKKGKKPFLTGYALNTNIKVGVRIGKNKEVEIKALNQKQQKELDRLKRLDTFQIRKNIYEFPMTMEPPKRAMSRFLAKMAYELLCSYYMKMTPDEFHDLLELKYFDSLRRYARHGDNWDEWPYHYRQYCPEETLMRHPDTNEWVQIGVAADLLVTDHPETYFSFSMHGHEFTLNVGGPTLKGYEAWLQKNNYISPLFEKNGLGLFQGLEGDNSKYYLAPLVLIDKDNSE